VVSPLELLDELPDELPEEALDELPDADFPELELELDFELELEAWVTELVCADPGRL
jgi:hypothetical protein